MLENIDGMTVDNRTNLEEFILLSPLLFCFVFLHSVLPTLFHIPNKIPYIVFRKVDLGLFCFIETETQVR